ncbi:hypothetical protein M5X17_27580 [Paenibacillus alvei]|uniref:hypothetical protein n=1 Tax=Paenibacillus alvei TaxID=44250 RepID=UPI002282F5DA|nr:hypothetical protein [Paenibacillus alvei]MCY9737467.1 hypothetical protein [Paenibacillus alvei]
MKNQNSSSESKEGVKMITTVKREIANKPDTVTQKQKDILKKMFGNVPSRFDLNKVRDWEKYEKD